ncbi:MAG: hypothetical protein FWG67_09805 [Defluviitaleaceae bacterium]|nr:hypothetical protein [Defluviitaleaceae bacterium]
MKKLLASLVILVVAITMMVACNSEEGINPDDLVGTWAWEEFTEWTYIFNADGTGSRGGGFEDVFDIEWRIVGDELHIECSVARFGVYSERWEMSIDQDALTLISLQDEAHEGFTYLRQ